MNRILHLYNFPLSQCEYCYTSLCPFLCSISCFCTVPALFHSKWLCWASILLSSPFLYPVVYESGGREPCSLQTTEVEFRHMITAGPITDFPLNGLWLLGKSNILSLGQLNWKSWLLAGENLQESKSRFGWEDPDDKHLLLLLVLLDPAIPEATPIFGLHSFVKYHVSFLIRLAEVGLLSFSINSVLSNRNC